MKYRSNSKEMMNKVGILVFYVNIGNLSPEEVEGCMNNVVSIIEPKNKLDDSQALNYWNLIFIPVRETESKVQVIRNDGTSDTGEIFISDLIIKLNETKIYI